MLGSAREAWIVAAGLALAWPSGAESPAWRPLGVAASGVGALGFDAPGERLAVGDARGVSWGEPGAEFRRVLYRGPVRDLVFASDDALLAATEAGLFRIEVDGRAAELFVAPGAAARDARRLAVASGLSAVATAAGVYVSRSGGRWQPASRAWPSGEASAVALRERNGAHECWAVIDGRLFSVSLASGEHGLVEADARRHLLPGTVAPNDVLLDAAGADVVVLLPDAFVVRATPDASWRRETPGLAPGARIERLLAARGALWLASDRGLWVAASLSGPWRRTDPPLGSAPVRAIAAAGARLVVAAHDGVRMATDPPPAPRGAQLRTPEGDPPIELVHRAVLDYLDLSPRRARELRRGVARRGWLPLVSLRAGRASDRDRQTDFDQSFVSGDTRDLLDQRRSASSDFDTSLTLTWDLGDIAYHPEAIDVSREAREIVKLRDDVLDEVNQLYFERRRVLAELAGASGDDAFRLRLRAAELAAGLDAWTGGWFARVRGGRLP